VIWNFGLRLVLTISWHAHMAGPEAEREAGGRGGGADAAQIRREPCGLRRRLGRHGPRSLQRESELVVVLHRVLPPAAGRRRRRSPGGRRPDLCSRCRRLRLR
jgi:hypothetical protein